MKLEWDFAESLETPITRYPTAFSLSKLSLKSQACLVHPGVESFG